jgi:ubiquinone/menaquinone biosynthesis C-methylase UbiE
VFERLAAQIGAAGRITGLDSSRTLFEEARRRRDHRSLVAELHEGDARRLPFDDAAFDATRSHRVLIFLQDHAWRWARWCS